MRQHTLDITRMGSMTKMGRIKYFRSMVVVGNGKGVYGFGVGFGNTPKEARADGVLRALQNLDYVDVDSGRMMTTPVKGHEYKHVCSIIPRPIGRGLQVNKKFLPLVHILGLDNCKVKFMHSKWFTRVKALKRALDMMMSRRTLAAQQRPKPEAREALRRKNVLGAGPSFPAIVTRGSVHEQSTCSGPSPENSLPLPLSYK